MTDSLAPKNGAARQPEFSVGAVEALLEHDWPGNVRELQNRVQRACLVGRSPQIEASDLGLEEGHLPYDRPSSPIVEITDQDPIDPEQSEIEEALNRAHGVISRAAADLGLSRQALYRRMARLGISVERRTLARL